MPLQPSGRFGSAVAVLDFNKDGVPDLAVGAPSVGSEKLTYTVRRLLGVMVVDRAGGEETLSGDSGGKQAAGVPGRAFVGRWSQPPTQVLDGTPVTWQLLFLPPWP